MNRFQKIGILAAAAFIALAPAIPQVFGIGHDYVRYWAMYSGVGQGTMKGTFTLTHADGTAETFTPLQIMELERYPNTFHYTFDRLVTDRAAIESIAAPFCKKKAADGARLDFSGKVGVANGWAIFEVEDICDKDDILIAEAE